MASGIQRLLISHSSGLKNTRKAAVRPGGVVSLIRARLRVKNRIANVDRPPSAAKATA